MQFNLNNNSRAIRSTATILSNLNPPGMGKFEQIVSDWQDYIPKNRARTFANSVAKLKSQMNTNYLESNRENIMATLLWVVCNIFKCDSSAILNGKRLSDETLPRHMFCFIASLMKIPPTVVARFIDRHHSTACNSVIVGTNLIDTDKSFFDKYNKIIEFLEEEL